MPIQCDEFEYCKVKVQYSADPELVDEKREEALKFFKKSKIRIPGFRPGKATDTAIKTHLKKEIEQWVQKELLANAYEDVLFETKMKPVGYPQILNVQLYDSTFFCDMIFLKKPDFELKEYKDFEIPKPHKQHNVNDLTEKMMQELRLRYGEIIPYGDGDFVQEGDQVTMDFTCKIDGEVFEPYTKEGILYTIGDNLIPDFDNHVLGMNAGEERDFDIIFTDGVVDELRDKRAKFHVKIHMGTKTIPCSLDDELAKKTGHDNFNKLRAEVQASASNQVRNVETQMISQQIISRLVENHDFKVPPWLMLMESQRLAAQQGIKWDDLGDEDKQMLNQRSSAGIKLSMVLDSIRDTEPEAVFSDDELIRNIKARVESTGQNGDEFLSRAQKDGSLFGMIASLKDEATIQWIISTCKVVE